MQIFSNLFIFSAFVFCLHVYLHERVGFLRFKLQTAMHYHVGGIELGSFEKADNILNH